MEYRVALQPDLGITPAEFVAAWNDASECRLVAEAHADNPTRTDYDLAVAAGVVLSVATGVASNALYDLVKQLLKRRCVRKRTRIVQLHQRDGTDLLVVTIDEG